MNLYRRDFIFGIQPKLWRGVRANLHMISIFQLRFVYTLIGRPLLQPIYQQSTSKFIKK